MSPLPINSKFIGVTALGARIARAVDFAARTDVWVVMGKPTAWTGTDPLTDPPNQPVSDLVPPLPNPSFTTLEEPVAAVKVPALQLVVPDNTNGVIEAYGMNWRVITPQDAAAEGCRWVLVNAGFNYNTVPTRAVDSYLTADVDIGDTVLPLFNAGGYQVGDNVIIGGVDGQQTTVDAVNVGANTITIADPLLAAEYAGHWVTDLSYPSAFQYRQVGIMSHVTFPAQAQPGQQAVPASWLTDGYLEWFYNDQPVPRRINGRDGVLVILTF